MGIINSVEERILRLYLRDILLNVSIMQIMKMIKSNSYSRTHEAVNRLVVRNILVKNDIGNTSLIRLNNSREAVLWMGFMEELNTNYIPLYYRIIGIEELSDYLLVITGSHAKRTHSARSDVDLAIIVPDHEDITAIHKITVNRTMLWKPKMHVHVLRKKDFTDMLLYDHDNFGKEMARHKIILKNARIYYELVLGAINHGYKG